MIEDQKQKEEEYFKMTKSRVMMMPENEVQKLRLAQSVVSAAMTPDNNNL